MNERNSTTSPHTAAPAHTSAEANGRDVTPIARTHRELAMLVERQSQLVADLLRVVEMDRARLTAAPTFPRETAIEPRHLIMAALERANAGRPGHLTTTELIETTGLAKSSVWHHVVELNDRGAVVVVRGKRGSDGKRGPDVVYHADAIAT